MGERTDTIAPWHAAVIDIVPSRLRQVVAHDPAAGSYGDCFRTVIACLIGANDPTDVPHFVAANIERGDDDPKGWADLRDARLWLRDQHDLDLFPLTRGDADDLGVHYKASVRSPLGVVHAVVAKEGRVVWCPAGWPTDEMQMIPTESAWVIARPWRPHPDEMVAQWRAEAGGPRG